mmetsp:Transcript_2045/g.8603  ORF Transcript_2045/g.8603 Transcript_2045/m.8603 type:complete len:425 (+) Transcript_2045:1154-2428(+)
MWSPAAPMNSHSSTSFTLAMSNPGSPGLATSPRATASSAVVTTSDRLRSVGLGATGASEFGCSAAYARSAAFGPMNSTARSATSSLTSSRSFASCEVVRGRGFSHHVGVLLGCAGPFFETVPVPLKKVPEKSAVQPLHAAARAAMRSSADMAASAFAMSCSLETIAGSGGASSSSSSASISSAFFSSSSSSSSPWTSASTSVFFRTTSPSMTVSTGPRGSGTDPGSAKTWARSASTSILSSSATIFCVMSRSSIMRSLAATAAFAASFAASTALASMALVAAALHAGSETNSSRPSSPLANSSHIARKLDSAGLSTDVTGTSTAAGAGSEPSPAFCSRSRARISFSRSARSRILAASSSFFRFSSTRSALRSESQFLNEGYFSRSTLHPSLCPASFLRVGFVPYTRRFVLSVFIRRVSSKDTDI